MHDFMRFLLPAMILLAVSGGHLFILVFKPHLIDKMSLYLNIGKFPVGRGWPITHICFASFGLMWGIDGLAVLLNGYGLISGADVPKMFVAGFFVVGVGVIYSLFSLVRSKRRDKKHR